MKLFIILCFWTFSRGLILGTNGQVCANGNRILLLGINPDISEEITLYHNQYRLLIAEGKIAGQPKGTNLKRMHYVAGLESKARAVSLTCELYPQNKSTNEIGDGRWNKKIVGQNVFVERNKELNKEQNWSTAVKAWFDEHVNYTYPNRFSEKNRHYTQLVWAETDSLACDFVLFHDYGLPNDQYVKLYTCNYGPGGNIIKKPPYNADTETGDCRGLCDSIFI